jgi:hypothetical protein
METFLLSQAAMAIDSESVGMRPLERGVTPALQRMRSENARRNRLPDRPPSWQGGQARQPPAPAPALR